MRRSVYIVRRSVSCRAEAEDDMSSYVYRKDVESYIVERETGDRRDKGLKKPTNRRTDTTIRYVCTLQI